MYLPVRIFYKNIQTLNLQNLPTDRPVILASNHPNSFMDAIVLGMVTKQKLNSLVRSDVFNSRLKRWFLSNLGLIPIYRIQEGTHQLHKNSETFEKCHDLFSKEKTVLIFSEGICKQERRLRKLKKGTARIAFGAEEFKDFKMGLVIVPVGLNYSKPNNFRSNVFVNFGESFEMSEFIDIYKQNKVKGINDFTHHLENKMRELIVVIENTSNDKLIEDIEEIYKKQLLKNLNFNSNYLQNDFKVTRQIANSINYFDDHDKESLSMIKQKTSHYLNVIRKLKLRDSLLHRKTIDSIGIFSSFMNLMLLIIGFPFHLFGLIGNYLPYKTSFHISNRKVTQIEFHSSVNLTLGTLLFIIFYLAQGIALSLFFQQPVVFVAYILLLTLSGWYSLYYWPFLKKTIGKLKLLYLLKFKRNTIEALSKERENIIIVLEKIIK